MKNCVVCRRPTEQRMTVPTAYGDLTLPRCEARDCHLPDTKTKE